MRRNSGEEAESKALSKSSMSLQSTNEKARSLGITQLAARRRGGEKDKSMRRLHHSEKTKGQSGEKTRNMRRRENERTRWRKDKKMKQRDNKTTKATKQRETSFPRSLILHRLDKKDSTWLDRKCYTMQEYLDQFQAKARTIQPLAQISNDSPSQKIILRSLFHVRGAWRETARVFQYLNHASCSIEFCTKTN